MMSLKKSGQREREGGGPEDGTPHLGRRLCFPRVAEGMQKTQGDHPSCRGPVLGGVRL